ncbi:hypothetical protein IFM5058_05022 [Aspergillus udagawae]|nr:hypothetical protein IFM5058_05022 [Aspergillus udagawae]
MFRSLVFSALFATTLGYRIFEYTGERCTGAEVGIHRLAGPSACNTLNEGVASSLLVKIDNVHDDQYSVNVYENDDCTGPIVGTVQNMNGCLNLHAFSNTVGKSVQVIPVSKRSSTPMSEGFETDYLYNLRAEDEEHMKVPIAHGLFRTVDRANHTEDGAYVDEAFGMFLTTDLGHVSSIQSLWTVPIEDATLIEPLNSSSTDFLEARQLEWAYCNFEALCLGAVALQYQVRNSESAQAVYRAFRDRPWTVIAQGIDFFVGRAANGITLIGTAIGSGSGNPDTCDTGKTTASLAQDLINSSRSEGLTNALWQLRDEDGRVWELGLQLREEGKGNSNNCGACPTCL